jgi:putative effector of murein hydrolase LrgA (UPF0299 family)
VLNALTIILVCQLAGEAMVLATGLPVPGPVLGMLLLFAGLWIRKGVPDAIDQTASGLLNHLSLLFVPAGVGAMVHWQAIRQDWAALSVALVVSTLIGLTVTALTMGVARRWVGRKERRHG